MTHSLVRLALCVTALGWALGAAAQPTVEWSGLAYVDYRYQLASDDPDAVGQNSFDYRRLYLTADAALSDDVSARARLEAGTGSTTAQGRPSPFVKDLWVRWRFAEAGHRATIGVQPPPVYEVAESVWGYRSLDKTLLDRAGLRSSRDFGLRFDGPLGDGGLRYAAMFANGNGVQRDPAEATGKRLYGQLAYRPERSPLRATLSADYSDEDLVADGLETSARASAFVGAVTARARGGVELAVLSLDDGVDAETGLGASVFGSVEVAPGTAMVGRYDALDATASGSGAATHYVLLALARRIAPTVQVMPNVVIERPEGADAEVVARVTVDVRF